MASRKLFDPLKVRKQGQAVKKEGWSALIPVPEDAPAPPVEHGRLGKPTLVHEYRERGGALVALVFRFDHVDGEKAFLPLTYCADSKTGRRMWRWKAPPPPRPLYRAHELGGHPEASIVLCEGEKAADAASRLLPDLVAVSSWGGANAAAKADWSALRGCHVVIWPDADAPGMQFAQEAARGLSGLATSVRLLQVPGNVEKGWDAADAEIEGWSTGRLMTLVANAESIFLELEKPNRSERSGSSGQKEALVKIADTAQLWHSPEKVAYVTFPVMAHWQNEPVRSKPFRHWLVSRYFDETDTAPGGQALEDALRVIEAQALFRGPTEIVHRRVAAFEERLYIDIGDASRQVIVVSADGWQVTANSPVKFIRSKHMRPLPVPEINDSAVGIGILAEFINCGSDGDFKLLVGWMLSALSPFGPYPILIFKGQQGSAKSTATRIVRELIDPNLSTLRVLPRDERDLMISAMNNHMLAYDNVSHVPAWLSDGLCRIATGGGFATRELHTDMDEVVMDAVRPVAMNGITDFVTRPDLGERAIVIDLPAIAPARRQTEAQFRKAFDRSKSAILGALLDGLSSALANRHKIHLDTLPRLADFGIWVTAAEPGLGWAQGGIVNAFAQNRDAALLIEFENDDVAQAIKKLSERGRWSGSASELKDELDCVVSDTTRRARSWPKTAASLGGRLKRLMPTLRQAGISAASSRTRDTRLWTIEVLR